MSAGGLTNIEQCPYSPDLNMCDRILFTRLQEHCRMQHYGSTEELKMDMQQFLRQLPKSLFLRELEKLKSHCEVVVRQSEIHTTATVCFILFVQAYFCALISCENIYGTYQVKHLYLYII